MTSSDRLAEAQRSRQKATKPTAQQQVVVKPAPQPAPQTAEPLKAPEEGRILIDSYPVREPFVRVVISQELDGSNKYIVVEPRLTIRERSQLDELKEALKNGLDLDVSKFDPSQAVGYLSTQTEEIMKKFGISIPPSSYEKIFYFIERDFLNYGKIDPIMRDPNIEDISCSGPELPVYVFHRTYESIRTNVSFKTQDEVEKFVLRLAYMSGKHISVAEPVVDASLPEGSRIQMTFGSEITKKGSSFTIRKFKADPYSIIDLIRFGTVNAEISALMWYALDNKSSVLLAGGTASGKTTSINCLALFIRPEAKIVTMEDTPEINLAHKNWIQSISRQGTAGMGEVTLYDLLRAALRQRPDFIIPGEVRGEEAQTMFQAISTGHAGMSSIHADSIAAVFNRLTNPPMSIPKTLLPALNFVLLQGRVTLKGRPARRILSVTEVVGLDPRSNELILNELYRYDVETDQYVYSGRSYNLEKLAKTRGMSLEEVRQELATRRQILQWMADGDMRRYRDVASVVQRYYTDRAGLLAEMGGIPA
ncbi:MAG: type II/IV secretion system ATPase subunit [Nitrososphaerales archaeon]|nr:type II/IV secretion system ATPase subunit [Nitrososphaerales archaeon]